MQSLPLLRRVAELGSLDHVALLGFFADTFVAGKVSGSLVFDENIREFERHPARARFKVGGQVRTLAFGCRTDILGRRYWSYESDLV